MLLTDQTEHIFVSRVKPTSIQVKCSAEKYRLII